MKDPDPDSPHEPEGTSRHSNGYRNFSSKQSNKIHGANPFTILNISLENNAEAKCKIFYFFSFLFKHLDFFRKIGQSFLCFSDFPKFTKHAKTFKNTSNLSIFNFSTSVLRLLVHNPINTIFTYIHLFISIIKTFQHSSIPCICFYQKIGLEPDLSRPPTYLVH